MTEENTRGTGTRLRRDSRRTPAGRQKTAALKIPILFCIAKYSKIVTIQPASGLAFLIDGDLIHKSVKAEDVLLRLFLSPFILWAVLILALCWSGSLLDMSQWPQSTL